MRIPLRWCMWWVQMGEGKSYREMRPGVSFVLNVHLLLMKQLSSFHSGKLYASKHGINCDIFFETRIATLWKRILFKRNSRLDIFKNEVHYIPEMCIKATTVWSFHTQPYRFVIIAITLIGVVTFIAANFPYESCSVWLQFFLQLLFLYLKKKGLVCLREPIVQLLYNVM